MTSPATTSPTRPLAEARRRFGLKGILPALVAWVIDADQRYRNGRRLRETPDHLLDDMGIKRSDRSER